MNKEKQRKLGAVIGFAQTGVTAIVSIIYIPILLRGIGSGEYGLYQLLGSVISYFSIMYSSLNASVTKYYTQYLIADDHENMENTLAISRRIFNVIAIVILIVALPVAVAFRCAYRTSLTPWELYEAIIMFAVMIANIMVYLISNVYSAAIMSYEHFVFRKGLDLASQCLQPVGVVLFIRRYPYALTIVAVQLALNIAIAAANYWYATKKLNVVIKLHREDKAITKEILSLSSSVLVVYIADQIFWKTDQLILGQMYGTKVTAIYSIGAQLNSAYINLGCVVGSVLLPMLTAFFS